MTIAAHRYALTADYRVAKREDVTDQIVRLVLLPVSARRLHYREGQYISIELANGELRSYSPATAMAADGAIELHVRLHPQGKFSTLLRERSSVLSSLKVYGPYGDCVWQTPTSPDAPILFLATGTGIAPIKALVQAALSSGCKNPVWLYWGARHVEELYESAAFEALESRHPNFHFRMSASTSDRDPGEPRYVQDWAARQHPDLADALVYACGLPAMVDAAQALLTQNNGLRAEHFFADAFVSATVPAAAPRPPADTLSVNATFDIHPPQQVTRNRLQLEPGTSLLHGLRVAGVLKGVCGGRQSCGTCRVSLARHWFDQIPPPARSEQRLLQALPEAGQLDRLACQIIIEPALDGLHFSIPALAV